MYQGKMSKRNAAGENNFVFVVNFFVFECKKKEKTVISSVKCLGHKIDVKHLYKLESKNKKVSLE